jgi:hypothetical protein
MQKQKCCIHVMFELSFRIIRCDGVPFVSNAPSVKVKLLDLQITHDLN